MARNLNPSNATTVYFFKQTFKGVKIHRKDQAIALQKTFFIIVNKYFKYRINIYLKSSYVGISSMTKRNRYMSFGAS